MNRLETLLKLSTIQAELRQLASDLDDDTARIVKQSASMLNLLSDAATLSTNQEIPNVIWLDDFR